MKISHLFSPLALGLALFIAAPTTAQQREEESQSEQPTAQSEEQRERKEAQRVQQQREQQQREQQQAFQRDRQREQRRERVHRDQRQATWELEPRSWVRVAVDYDGDGRYDAVEEIYAFDLERARTASRDRQQRMAVRERGQQRPQYDMSYRGDQDQQRPTLRQQFREAFTGRQQQQPRFTRVEGEVRNVRSMQFSGIEGKEKLAHIVTDQGRTERVALGPEDQLEQLELEEGARVSISGYRGAINDRPVIFAQQVEAHGDTVRVNRQRGMDGVQRYHGEVLQTRTTRLRDQDERQVIAHVRLDDGQTMQVILGPQSKVRQLDLQEGDEVALLAQQARLNQQPALVAQQIAANEQVVRIDEPEQERFQRQSPDQPEMRQREQRERQQRIQREQLERQQQMQREQRERESVQQRERERADQPERERDQEYQQREREQERERPEA